jgi:hypothetical protein
MVSLLTKPLKILVPHRGITDKVLLALVDIAILGQIHRVATTVRRATIRMGTTTRTLRNLLPTPTPTLRGNTTSPLAATTSINNQATIRDLPEGFNHNKAHMEGLRNHTKEDHRKVKTRTSSIKLILVNNLHTTREPVILVLHHRATMAGSRLTLAGDSATIADDAV